MKRVLSLFLAMLLCLSSGIGILSPAAYCQDYDDPLADSSVPPTDNTTPSETCTDGKEHSYLGKITVPPTETTSGTVVFTCTVCGATVTMDLPPMQTEEARGSKVYTMPGVGPYDEYGHSYGRIEGGTYSAKQRGTLWDDELPSYNCPAKSSSSRHDYKYHIGEPTCTLSDYDYYECTTCGEKELQKFYPALGHAYTIEVTTFPTETTPGVRTFTCETCGDTYTEEIPVSSNGSFLTVPEGTGPVDSYGRCYTRVPGGIYFAKQKNLHLFDEKIKEYDCPAAEGYHHNLVTHKAQPTCTYSDYNYTYCSRCGETEVYEFVDALGHDYVATLTVPPTETTPGQVTVACTRCGDSGVKTISPTGKEEERDCKVYVPEGFGPFDEYGHSYGRVVRGTYFAEQTGESRWSAKISNYECPVTGKRHSTKWHSADPSCSQGDYNYYECKDCGEIELQKYFPAKGHKYTMTVTTQPTETTPGVRTFTCDVCGDTYTETISAATDGCLITVPKGEGPFDNYGRSYGRVEGGIYFGQQTGANSFTRKIGTYTCPANNGKRHELKNHVAAPTCVLSDYDYQYCTRCGEMELYALHEALGHDYAAKLTTSPTETTPGEITYTCTRCGDSYTKPVSATGATGAQGCKIYVPEGNGPFDDYGRSYGRVDGGTYFAEQTGEHVCQPRIGTYPCSANNGKPHQLADHTADPSCTLSDYWYKYCTLCGEIELQFNHPALGHEWTFIITEPATPAKDGLKTYTCSRCGEQYTETIPALAEARENTVYEDPTAAAHLTRNVSRQDYETYSPTVNSYLYRRYDGLYCRVELVGNVIAVEMYSPEFKLLTSKEIPMELEEFEGFYCGASANYLLFGQNNHDESNSREVYRVVKYDKNWYRTASASIYGDNVYDPDHASMTEYNGYLYIHACRTMYESPDGKHHQSNVNFILKEDTMKVLDHSNPPFNLDLAYTSHSFNQFIAVDNSGYLVAVNHGDAYPREIALRRFWGQAGNDQLTASQNGVYSISMLDLFGEIGDNYTGASLGGFGISNTAYFTVENSNSQTKRDGMEEARNIVVSVLPIDQATKNDAPVQTTYLTRYSTTGNQTVSTPQLVKFSDNLFLVMWEKKNWNSAQHGPYSVGSGSGTIEYAFLDGNGKMIGSVRTTSGYLSDCQPIVADGKAVWYVTGSEGSSSAPVFYTMDQSGNLKTYQSKASEPFFKDVPTTHWAFKHVQRAHKEGIVNGTSTTDNIYEPGKQITLAEFAAMLVNMYYYSEDANTAAKPWYAGKMAIVESHGLLNGVDDTSPTGTINRYNMAMMLYNMMKDRGMLLPEYEDSSAAKAHMPDWSSIPAKYQIAVATCYNRGIISGDQTGAFGGTGKMDRASLAAIYCNFRDSIETGV